jgi:hypothetical protein
MRVNPETETESACLVLELGEGAEHKGEGGEEDNAQARPRKYLKAWNIINPFFVSSQHTVPETEFIYEFPEKELRGLSPNSYIHVSVSDLYVSRIDPRI